MNEILIEHCLFGVLVIVESLFDAHSIFYLRICVHLLIVGFWMLQAGRTDWSSDYPIMQSKLSPIELNKGKLASTAVSNNPLASEGS